MTDLPEMIVDTLVALIGPDSDNVEQVEGVSACWPRPLRRMDGNGAVGIALDEWYADEYEIGSSRRTREPTISTYAFTIQHLVKNAKESDAQAQHRKVARRLRLVLETYGPLSVALQTLVSTDDDRTERIMNWHVPRQRFDGNEIDGSFVYLSGTELIVKTQTS